MTNPTLPTRDRIRLAAAELFGRDGFAGTGVREIAAAAGVTPALVIRYFGSKEALFLLTIQMDEGLAPLMAGPLETLGADLVTFLLAGPRDPAKAGIFASLMRASDRPAVRESLQASMVTSVLAPLVPRLAGPDAELRARLVSAGVIGLLGALDLVGDEVLAAAEAGRIAALYGAALQALITPAQ